MAKGKEAKAFDDLMRGLVQVPKKELDRAERQYQKRKQKKKDKKS